MTLPYETIFSRTRGRINDPKELSLDENDLLEIYTERLHNVLSNPRVRQLFSSTRTNRCLIRFSIRAMVSICFAMNF